MAKYRVRETYLLDAGKGVQHPAGTIIDSAKVDIKGQEYKLDIVAEKKEVKIDKSAGQTGSNDQAGSDKKPASAKLPEVKADAAKSTGTQPKA